VQKARRRQQVFDSAKEVFSKKGFHKASISDIIQRAGIARGTFYLYFKNKRHVFHSLLESLLQELDQRITLIKLGKGNPPPFEQLRANLTRIITFSLEEPHLIRILFHSAVGLDKEFEQELHRFYEKLADRIERALKLGIEMDLVRPCPTRLVAYGILGALKEVMAQLASKRISSRDVKVVVDALLEFGLRGVVVNALGD
jgi:AcrR family transcriptional regulator